ncbi:hypothetical protein ACU4GD_19745 [Cupriavidus basilensis]
MQPAEELADRARIGRAGVAVVDGEMGDERSCRPAATGRGPAAGPARSSTPINTIRPIATTNGALPGNNS